jgi:hypothetical protein
MVQDGGALFNRTLLALIVLALLSATAALHDSGQTRAAPYVFETEMYGTNVAPPVNTVTWGFFRFFFSEDRLSADVTVDVKGMAGDAVTSADIRRGAPGTNGPVVKHVTDGGFIVTSRRVTFNRAELDEMAAGLWYITLSTRNNPEGELRGQIQPPADFLAPLRPPPPPPPPVQQPAPALVTNVPIRPPNTGDAGLR